MGKSNEERARQTTKSNGPLADFCRAKDMSAKRVARDARKIGVDALELARVRAAEVAAESRAPVGAAATAGTRQARRLTA